MPPLSAVGIPGLQAGEDVKTGHKKPLRMSGLEAGAGELLSGYFLFWLGQGQTQKMLQ